MKFSWGGTALAFFFFVIASRPCPAHDDNHGIPRFDAAPTITSARSGPWFASTTWSPRRVPSRGDVVAILPRHTVTLASSGEARVVGIRDGGVLQVDPGWIFSSHALRCETLLVHQGGRLQVGYPWLPVSAQSKVRFVFRDTSLDTSTVEDPEQMSHGLLCLGDLRVYGAQKTPYLRLAREPKAGDTFLTFSSSPSGWRPGDRLALPDTRQIEFHWAWWYNYDGIGRTEADFQWEEMEVAEVTGNTVRLAAPLRFNHFGARDSAGALRFLPHVANLSRSVEFRSENPRGVRGHCIITGGARAELNWVAFVDMGRTTVARLDPSTNHIGRYPIHIHYAHPGLDEAGYSGYLRGVVVDGSPRWGIAVHGSDSLLVQDTVAYNCVGSGFVTEDGTESWNVFERCFALRAFGNRSDDVQDVGEVLDNGVHGDGFWMRGGRNTVRNCVVANATNIAYNYWSYNSLDGLHMPNNPGDSRDVEGQYTEVRPASFQVPFGVFEDNEAYGATERGVLAGAVANAPLVRFTAWHVKYGHYQFLTHNVTVVDPIFIGDSAQIGDDPFIPWLRGTQGMIGDGGGAAFSLPPNGVLVRGEFHNLLDISVRD